MKSIVDILLENTPVQKWLTGLELLAALRLVAKELPELGISAVDSLYVSGGINDIALWTSRGLLIVKPRGAYQKPEFVMYRDITDKEAEYVDMIEARCTPFIQVKSKSIMLTGSEIVKRLETTKLGLELREQVSILGRNYYVSYGGNCYEDKAYGAVDICVAIEKCTSVGDEDGRATVYCAIYTKTNTCRINDPNMEHAVKVLGSHSRIVGIIDLWWAQVAKYFITDEYDPFDL